MQFRRVEGQGQDWGIQVGTCPVPDHTTVLRRIHEGIINRHWLVYDSAQEHAEALADSPVDELRRTLPSDMADAYGILLSEAHELFRAAQEWLGTR